MSIILKKRRMLRGAWPPWLSWRQTWQPPRSALGVWPESAAATQPGGPQAKCRIGPVALGSVRQPAGGGGAELALQGRAQLLFHLTPSSPRARSFTSSLSGSCL